jgi:glycosyltransferase involved in cell wall biosynthesis
LDSAIEQDFTDWELILVDDGSTDGTSEICDEYAEKDARIKVIHQKNSGVSTARNAGIDAAVGEYFLFFDGDDFFLNETCREVVALMETHEVDAVIYGYYRWDGGITETCLPLFPEGLYEEKRVLHEIMPRFIGVSYDGINTWISGGDNGLYVENPALWRIMIKGEIVRRNGLRFDPRLKIGEDTLFMSEYLSYAESCWVEHKCYYYLVARETSAISTYSADTKARMLEKNNISKAREELTERLKQRLGLDISDYWRGTVVMSCAEVGLMMSAGGFGFRENYRQFREFAASERSMSAVRDFPLRFKLGVRAVPFVLLKARLYFPLFVCFKALNLAGNKFKRN